MRDKIIISNKAESKKLPAPNISINDVIEIVSDLSEILTKETFLLKKKHIKEVEKLQQKKEILTEKLEIFKQVLRRDPNLFGDFPKQKRKELESVVGIFDKLLEENYRELVKARAVNSKVVEAVSFAISDRIRSREGYNKEGSLSDELSMPAITYNKNI